MKSKLLSINTTDFYTSFFEKHQNPEVIKSISLFDEPIGCADNSEDGSLASKSYILESVPNYLDLTPKKGFHAKKTTIKPGIAIKINKACNSVEDYLKAECSKNFKKVTMRAIKRLEACFNITYKTFFGNITEVECNELMDKLKILITDRFSERSGRNNALKKWDYFTEAIYKGINNKTASLFVIYDEDLPIQISLNFLYRNIMVGSVSSYDIDYSKFSLGNLGIYKELEWCMKNGMALFDIGFGDFEYKRRWANLIYDFETLYLSQKSNPLHNLYFYLHEKKAKLVYYLIAKEYNNLYFDTLAKFKREKKNHEAVKFEEFDANGHTFSQEALNCNGDYSFIKKPMCDFAYTNTEHFSNLKLYEATNDSNIYLIKGKCNESCIKVLSV